MTARPYSFTDSVDYEAWETVLGLKVGKREHHLVDAHQLLTENGTGQVTEETLLRNEANTMKAGMVSAKTATVTLGF